MIKKVVTDSGNKKGVTSFLSLLGVSFLIFSMSAALTVPNGWPKYLAMGAITHNEKSDLKNGCKVDAVFTYDGDDGGGDRGKIVYPSKSYNLCALVAEGGAFAVNNKRGASNPIPVIVPYVAEFSTSVEAGKSDLTDADNLAKHFVNLMLTCEVLQWQKNTNPSIILNPDCLGTIQQKTVTFAQVPVNVALQKALYFITKKYEQFAINKTPPLTPFESYINNPEATKGTSHYKEWEEDAVNAYGSIHATQTITSLPDKDLDVFLPPNLPSEISKITVPAFTDDLKGWIQAQNWIIRTFAPASTFAWQLNIWADPNSPGGPWVHKGCWTSPDDIKTNIKNFLDTYEVFTGKIKPDYIAFDKYAYDEFNSSLWAGAEWYAYTNGYVFNCDDWNTYLDLISYISHSYNLPIMLWQMPGGHLVTADESKPMTTDGSTSATYFLGDPNIKSDLSNLAEFISTPNDTFPPSAYYYTTEIDSVSKYLLSGTDTNWKAGHLRKTINSGVFAVLWGEGHTVSLGTYPIDDKGWLNNRISAISNTDTALVGAPW